MSNVKKYPRTYHLPFSEGVTSDDKIIDSLSQFEGEDIVITEKMDGENTTMMTNRIFARSIDSIDHPSRHWVKGLWGRMGWQIPKNYRICGENLFAEHSIHYTDLPSYFLVFSVWDDENRCLSWDEAMPLIEKLGLLTVPVLYRGPYNLEIVKQIIQNLNFEKQEGIVIRNTKSFHYDDFKTNVAKYVRKNHVQTDQHWMQKKIIKNDLKENE